jgi:hypothetical protein
VSALAGTASLIGCNLVLSPCAKARQGRLKGLRHCQRLFFASVLLQQKCVPACQAAFPALQAIFTLSPAL